MPAFSAQLFPQGGGGGGSTTVWWTGIGVPSGSIGVDGDLALNTANGDIYKKIGNLWGAPIANITGPAGAAGINGATWTKGVGAPAGGVGVNGDLYLDGVLGDVYLKAAGVWGITANIRGPAGTIASRGDIVKTTGSLVAGQVESNYIDPFAKSFAIVKVTVDRAARVRLYSTAAQRDADVLRNVYTPPTYNTSHGIILDIVLDGSAAAPLANFICSPEVYGANADNVVLSRVYYNITNLSGGTSTVTVTLNTKIEEA